MVRALRLLGGVELMSPPESTGVAATAHSDVHSAKCCKLAPCGLRDAGAKQ